jgi:hypothetical protein
MPTLWLSLHERAYKTTLLAVLEPSFVACWPRLCDNPFVDLHVERPGIGFAARVGSDTNSLRLHRLQQRSATQNRYCTFHIVGEHIQRHLGRNLVLSSHQEVRGTHPGLYGSEGMLGRLTA